MVSRKTPLFLASAPVPPESDGRTPSCHEGGLAGDRHRFCWTV